jgi:hypothetical protein
LVLKQSLPTDWIVFAVIVNSGFFTYFKAERLQRPKFFDAINLLNYWLELIPQIKNAAVFAKAAELKG